MRGVHLWLAPGEQASRSYQASTTPRDAGGRAAPADLYDDHAGKALAVSRGRRWHDSGRAWRWVITQWWHLGWTKDQDSAFVDGFRRTSEEFSLHCHGRLELPLQPLKALGAHLNMGHKRTDGSLCHRAEDHAAANEADAVNTAFRA